MRKLTKVLFAALAGICLFSCNPVGAEAAKKVEIESAKPDGLESDELADAVYKYNAEPGKVKYNVKKNKDGSYTIYYLISSRHDMGIEISLKGVPKNVRYLTDDLTGEDNKFIYDAYSRKYKIMYSLFWGDEDIIEISSHVPYISEKDLYKNFKVTATYYPYKVKKHKKGSQVDVLGRAKGPKLKIHFVGIPLEGNNRKEIKKMLKSVIKYKDSLSDFDKVLCTYVGMKYSNSVYTKDSHRYYSYGSGILALNQLSISEQHRMKAFILMCKVMGVKTTEPYFFDRKGNNKYSRGTVVGVKIDSEWYRLEYPKKDKLFKLSLIDSKTKKKLKLKLKKGESVAKKLTPKYKEILEGMENARRSVTYEETVLETNEEMVKEYGKDICEEYLKLNEIYYGEERELTEAEEKRYDKLNTIYTELFWDTDKYLTEKRINEYLNKWLSGKV